MASIKKRGKFWQAKLYYYDKDGKRHAKSKSGFETKKEAEIFARNYEIKIENGEISKKGAPFFPEYYLEWFETYREPGVTNRTKVMYRRIYKSLKKYFDGVPIDEIDRKDYQKFMNWFGSTRAKSTVIKLGGLIHSSVRDAALDNLIKTDFARNVNYVYDKSKTRKIDYLNIKEMELLTKSICESLDYHNPSEFMILVIIYSGMRLGEIQGLTWDDININFKTITVNKSWNFEENKFQTTKTVGSNRIIRVNRLILEVLEDFKKHQNPKSNKERIFINENGVVPNSRAVNKTLRAYLKKLNIEKKGFHFYSLRHTHVAFLLSQGVDLYIISKRLGHSDITITSRVYSYLIDEYKNKSDNRIESILNGITKTDNPTKKTIVK